MAMLAGGLSCSLAAPPGRGNPHEFASLAVAAVAADEVNFVAAQSFQLSTPSAEDSAYRIPAASTEQLEAAQREKLVREACEILTKPAPPTNSVEGVSGADLSLDEPSSSEFVAQVSLTRPDTSEREWIEELPPRVRIIDDCDAYQFDDWTWQWLPTGLIYRSYMAGVHEPRAAIVAFHEGEQRTLWDATLGGRFGILRCGDCDPLRPQGWQVDFYGAAIARLDVENQQDLDSTDYVFGVPLTYGTGDWQFKFGYAHLSSHLGDELALRDAAALDERRNYVRDAIVFGTSVFLHPVWRQYGEVGWAFHHSGGAQPWEAQFGTELSRPGPGASPFLAVNGRMREEHDFGGDLTVQAGWLRRGGFGQTMRVGAHYYNGKSSQFQFFDQAEEQIGLGLWYDF